MMLLHTAVGAMSAGTGAGIVAAEAHASLACWTVRIHLALVAMTASQRCWVSRQTFWTDASHLAIAGQNTIGIGSTRVGVAGRATGFTATLVGISNIAGTTVTFLTIANHITFGIATTRSWLAEFHRLGRLVAAAEGISNLIVRAVADGLTRRVTDGSVATRIGLTGIDGLHTATNCVGTLHIARQASALGEAIAQHSALCVGTTRRWLAWIRGQLAGNQWRLSLVFG